MQSEDVELAQIAVDKLDEKNNQQQQFIESIIRPFHHSFFSVASRARWCEHVNLSMMNLRMEEFYIHFVID